MVEILIFMNSAHQVQLISALHEAVNNGNKERMCQCAYLLDTSFLEKKFQINVMTVKPL